MIPFAEKTNIDEWLVNLENNLTMLKAYITCEENRRNVVERSTSGHNHIIRAKAAATDVKHCAEMLEQLLKKVENEDRH